MARHNSLKLETFVLSFLAICALTGPVASLRLTAYPDPGLVNSGGSSSSVTSTMGVSGSSLVLPGAATQGAAQIQPASASPSVLDTLVLANNSLIPGNFNLTSSNNLGPASLAYDSGKGEFFVSGISGPVTVVSDVTDTIVSSFNASLGQMTYDPTQGELFAASPFDAFPPDNTLAVISDSTNSVIANVSLPVGPVRGVCFDVASGEVYATAGDTVQAVFAANDTLGASVRVGTDPGPIAYDAGAGELFVANTGSDNVSIVSLGNLSVIGTVRVGGSPDDLSYDAAQGEIFVTNNGSDNVTVISDANNSVIDSIPLGGTPSGVAYDPVQADLFVPLAARTSQT